MTLTSRGRLRECRDWNYSWACRAVSGRLTGAAREAVTMTTITQADSRIRDQQPMIISRRSPVRVAVLSLVTFSVYGFWWWWDINRQLRALGQPAHPWRALVAVTAGWIAVIPPFWSAQHTSTMIAAAERGTGIPDTVSAPVAVTIAAVAAAGAAAWTVLSLAALPAGIYIGLAWPLLAMVFIGYLQHGLNRAAGEQAGR
jgi:hypothetical protein